MLARLESNAALVLVLASVGCDLTLSRVLRMVFLATDTCQDSLCFHGLDQSSLWVGRGLTFAGAGLLIEAGVTACRCSAGSDLI